MKYCNIKRIERPEIFIEYSSITLLPRILFFICTHRKKKFVLSFTCGEHTIGKQTVYIKPVYRLKKVRV